MENGQLIYTHYLPAEEGIRETLCTLGNGYFATRGAQESCSGGEVHYPGTYLAGGYDRLESQVQGEVVEQEDLVNWPNWLVLTFRPAQCQEWFSPEIVEMVEYRQVLDVCEGMLHYYMRFRAWNGRETLLESSRLVHMRQRHLAAIRWKLTPQNWSGDILIHSALDGSVSNRGVKRYRELNGRHLEPLATGRSQEHVVYLVVRSRQSAIHLAEAAALSAYENGVHLTALRTTHEYSDSVDQQLLYHAQAQHTVTVEKVVSLYTSRDMAISEPVAACCAALQRGERFDQLRESHCRCWGEYWHRCAIDIRGNDRTCQILHLHTFHLLQTASMNTLDRDAGVPPRGWHGEAYRGHILWDELFIFPFLNMRMPVLTRALLMYRYRRLDAARELARQAGFAGAMYPWQSGSSGREESQTIHLNPHSGRWIPDNTHLQRHVNAAIAYNVWQYYQVTLDKEFLYDFGAEMVVEIARFWASIARFNPERERFEIHGVVGPDEYHTAYADAPQEGINNNAYTNFLAAWVLRRALDILALLDDERREELCADLGIDAEEQDRWEQMSRRMFIPFIPQGIIEQFEGYGQLKELDWELYRKRYGENMRLDRILESEDDSVNRYKAAKQADVLMLLYLFSAEELCTMFERLGYDFDPAAIPRIVDYYSSRASHGSTLSRLVFSWVLARSDRAHSWHVYEKTLLSDVADVQGGTTAEGIHLGAMAGTVDMMQRCYGGIEVREDVLWINPALPDTIQELRQRIRYRGHWLGLVITHRQLQLRVERGWGNPIRIGHRGQVYTVSEKQTLEFALP
jgi:trehalose/maltose hydrolase-like predicted phosphorylase